MNNDMSSYFEDPEFKEILAKYEGMAQSHTPTYFDAEELTDIAEYYASINEEDKADQAIQLALQLHPSNTDALIFKSRSLAIKGKIDEAYRIADLIEDSSDREVKFLKADLLIEERRFDEAELVLQELAESEGYSFEVLMDITMTFMDTNQKAYAKKWLEKIKEKGINITNNQTFRDAWCDFCMTFGEPENALEAFQLSLDELPYSIRHWNGLAKCYLAQTETIQAHEAVDFALAIDDKDEEALEVKGFCHLQSENYEKAIRIFQKLLPTSKYKSRIYSFIAKCHMEQENVSEGLNICLEWLKECPELTNYEKSEIYSYIAMSYSQLNQPAEGMKFIDEAININPFYRGAILQKGMLHLQLKEDIVAEQLFQKTLDLSPDDEQMEVLYSIANCYLWLGKYHETIEWCQKIITNYPNDKLEALVILATCYFYENNPQLCLAYITQAWKMDQQQLNENLTNDKRFIEMFAKIKELLSNYNNNEE